MFLMWPMDSGKDKITLFRQGSTPEPAWPSPALKTTWQASKTVAATRRSDDKAS